MTAPAEPRHLRADAARNRQALIEAAERLLTDRGLAVTLDDVARAAEVNVATAYRHFANKRELFTAVLRQPIDEAIRATELATEAADPAQALHDYLKHTAELLISHRALSQTLYQPELVHDGDARLEPVIDRLLDRTKQAGVMREDVQPGDLRVIIRMLADLGDIPAGDRPALVDRYLTIIVAGLRPGASPLPGHPPTVAQSRDTPSRPGRR